MTQKWQAKIGQHGAYTPEETDSTYNEIMAKRNNYFHA